jgi:phage tail-like protein
VTDNSTDKRASFELEIIDPEGNRRRFPLAEGGADVAVTIGRQPGNDLTFNDQRISRQHALIACTSTGCRIVDMNSANGTYVNAERIPPEVPVPLKPGDELRVGSYQMILWQAPDFANEAIEDASSEDEAATPQANAEERGGGMPPSPPAPTKPSDAGELAALDFGLYSQKLIDYLPGIYHTDFMRRFLAIFETILLPIEWNIDNFDLLLSPGTVTLAFLPWLEGWFDITADPSWSEAQRRQLLKEAPRIFARRGTRWALSRVLEIYTGQAPTIIDVGADLDAFTFRVIIPAGTESERNRRELIERLIDAHKPAHTYYTLELTA